MAETNLPYDPTDKTSIVTYAKRLVGKSLRQTTDIGHIESPQTRRGSYGNAIEEHYFMYQPTKQRFGPRLCRSRPGTQSNTHEESQGWACRQRASRHLYD